MAILIIFDCLFDSLQFINCFCICATTVRECPFIIDMGGYDFGVGVSRKNNHPLTDVKENDDPLNLHSRPFFCHEPIKMNSICCTI